MVANVLTVFFLGYQHYSGPLSFRWCLFWPKIPVDRTLSAAVNYSPPTWVSLVRLFQSCKFQECSSLLLRPCWTTRLTQKSRWLSRDFCLRQPTKKVKQKFYKKEKESFPEYTCLLLVASSLAVGHLYFDRYLYFFLTYLYLLLNISFSLLVASVSCEMRGLHVLITLCVVCSNKLR